jgi:hypothetical protein
VLRIVSGAKNRVGLQLRQQSGLAPGAAATIDADDRGHPLRSLRDLPAGE